MANRWQTTLLGIIAVSSTAWPLPEGGQVIQGSLQIVQPGTNILQVLQSSPSGIINWGSFNIDANQLVQFLQPNSSAALLNRVIGQDPSHILGQLQANGRILLVNPNGMLFGPGSSINAGSFLASTLSIQDQDFMEGRYALRWDGQSPMRAIVNQGEIRVNEGGFLALISPLIDNQGLLLAERGQVVLGATRQATLTVDAQGLLQVAIPDGFSAHSGALPNAQTVLLTPGQMSDTLSQLIRPAASSDSAAIVETAQGIQLVGAEGLLLNQGAIRADATQGTAGSILLDSSQATVLAPSGLVSASSAQGDGGQILALSAGSTVQMGQLQARSQSAGDGGFVEVSGQAVQLTQGADLSAPDGRPGQLLIDPVNITVVAAGGTSSPPILFGAPGASLTVNANALNVTGTVTLQANNDLTIDDNVQVNIDTTTDLNFSAGHDFNMRPGSAINASSAGSTVSINATNSVMLTDLKVPTSHVLAGNKVEFQGGTVGQTTSDTVLNVSAGQITNLQGTQLDVVGQTLATVALNATNDVTLRRNSQVNLLAPQVNLTVQGDGAGVTMLDGSSISTNGAANFTFSSANSGIAVIGSLTIPGLANITINSPTSTAFLPGTISASHPASTVNVSSSGQLTLGNLLVPTSHLSSANVVQLNDTTVGVTGSPTLLNVTANGIVAATAGSTVNILGSSANVTMTSNTDIFFGQDSTFNVQAPANLTFNATTQNFMGVNSTLDAQGAANISFNTSGGDILLREGSTIKTAGPGNINLSASTNIDQRDSSTINASDPGARVNLNGPTGVAVGNLLVSNSNITSGGAVDFQNSTLGRAGSPTVVNVSSNDINFGTDAKTRVLGSQANVQLNATNQLTMREGSRLGVTAGQSNVTLTTGILQMRNNTLIQDDGVGNYSITGGILNMDPGSTINASNPASMINMDATNSLSVASLQVPTIQLHSAGDMFLVSGILGQPAGPTSITASTGNDFFVLTGHNVTLDGTQVDLQVNSNRHIFVGGSNLTVNGNNNNIDLNAVGFNLMQNNSSFSAAGATRFNMVAGQQAALLTNSTLSLPNAGSNVSLNSPGTIFMNRVVSGGRVAANSTAGNIRLTDQVQANDIFLTTPDELESRQLSSQPAVVANHTLNITAGRIFGPMDDPSRDITKAFPITTSNQAMVRLNVTGTNNTATGNRAANLFYYFPQSGDVQVVNPNGEVKIFNEPGPVPPTSPAPSGVIDSRDDLTPEQFVEVTSVSALTQIQLSNLYSAAYLPTTSDVIMLNYDNIGLTNYSVVPLSSALVELAVLSPENSARNLDRIEKEGAEATSLVIVGNDEDSELRYWRKLIEGFILWEED
ncbi:filamentous hemagglutinin N-terminal domain-containing protein [bacterium]|nr:filamentous hemagglutinin N-terminal domain-containing protein [bacterium]